MLKQMTIATLVLVISFWSEQSLSDTGGTCPVTLGTDKLLGKPFSESGIWYGSEALAVALPADGNWGVTVPTARIAVKLFWRSAGFRPGMQTNLKVEITNLNGQPNDAVVKDITTANSIPEDREKAQSDDEWLDGWAMLTGIDFPSPGCWQITGEYLGQSLTFVVETVDNQHSGFTVCTASGSDGAEPEIVTCSHFSDLPEADSILE